MTRPEILDWPFWNRTAGMGMAGGKWGGSRVSLASVGQRSCGAATKGGAPTFLSAWSQLVGLADKNVGAPVWLRLRGSVALPAQSLRRSHSIFRLPWFCQRLGSRKIGLAVTIQSGGALLTQRVLSGRGSGHHLVTGNRVFQGLSFLCVFAPLRLCVETLLKGYGFGLRASSFFRHSSFPDTESAQKQPSIPCPPRL